MVPPTQWCWRHYWASNITVVDVVVCTEGSCYNLPPADEINGLVQERRNSIANALELRLSCTNPSRCTQHNQNNLNEAYICVDETPSSHRWNMERHSTNRNGSPRIPLSHGNLHIHAHVRGMIWYYDTILPSHDTILTSNLEALLLRRLWKFESNMIMKTTYLKTS